MIVIISRALWTIVSQRLLAEREEIPAILTLISPDTEKISLGLGKVALDERLSAR